MSSGSVGLGLKRMPEQENSRGERCACQRTREPRQGDSGPDCPEQGVCGTGMQGRC